VAESSPAACGRRPEDIAMRLVSEHGLVVLPGMLFGAASWECRVSLASLDADQLRAVGEAVVSVLTTACVLADDDDGDRSRR
jgi:aspartate/methionine/tyrosine aminotransferase